MFSNGSNSLLLILTLPFTSGSVSLIMSVSLYSTPKKYSASHSMFRLTLVYAFLKFKNRQCSVIRLALNSPQTVYWTLIVGVEFAADFPVDLLKTN